MFTGGLLRFDPWPFDPCPAWISWLVDDVLGPERLDEALTWAFKGAHSVVIPGPVKRLAKRLGRWLEAVCL